MDAAAKTLAERITDFLNRLRDHPPHHRYAQLRQSPDLYYFALKPSTNGQHKVGRVNVGYLIRATFENSSPKHALVVSRDPSPSEAPTPIAGGAPVPPTPAPVGGLMVMSLNSDGSGYTTERLANWIQGATSAHFAITRLASETPKCLARAQTLGSMPWDAVKGDVWNDAAFVVFCMIGQYVRPDLINSPP